MNEKQKWRYMVNVMCQFMNTDDLNNFASLGWELAFIHGTPSSNYVYYTFRRALPDEANGPGVNGS